MIIHKEGRNLGDLVRKGGREGKREGGSERGKEGGRKREGVRE